MTFEMPKGQCAHCGARFDSGTWGDGPDLGSFPAAGSLLVCLVCAGVNQWCTSGKYEAVSDAALQLMPLATQARIMQMRENVKTLRPRIRT